MSAAYPAPRRKRHIAAISGFPTAEIGTSTCRTGTPSGPETADAISPGMGASPRSMTTAGAPADSSTWVPLRRTAFRTLWIASFVSEVRHVKEDERVSELASESVLQRLREAPTERSEGVR